MRSWLIIPAMGVAAGGSAFALEAASPAAVIGAALAGAAIAAAIRELAGESAAALTAAVIAPLLAITVLIDHGGIELVRHGIALAAAAWTITELARLLPTGSPLVAMLPAIVATVLDPSFVLVLVIAGTRLVTSPWPRPRWIIAVPIACGGIAILALVAGLARGGALGRLGALWCDATPHPIAFPRYLALAGETLGPIAAVVALGGLASIAARVRWSSLASLAIVASVACAVLVDLRAGAVGASTLGLAALLAGVAIVRFAGLIRLPSGQACAAAATGALLLVPPVWTTIEHGRRVAIADTSR